MQIAMQVSPLGVHLVSEFEGLRLDAYEDIRGVWTIGYGHTGPEVVDGMTITQDQAIQILHDDLGTAVRAINQYIAVQLNQNQFDALVSLVYNIGSGEFRKSTLRHLINDGDMIDAAAQFPRFDKAGGKESAGLLKRRLQERDLFLAKVQAN